MKKISHKKGDDMSKLGSTLKNKRETLGLDVDKVTEETRISADIIDVLEKGEYKSMPSYNHAKNFVKNYAEYLKLEQDKVQALFEEECTKEDFDREVVYVTAPVTKEKGSASSGVRFAVPLIIVAVLLFGGYKVFEAMQKSGLEEAAARIQAEETAGAVTGQAESPVNTDEVKEVINSIKESAEKPAQSETKPAGQQPKPAAAVKAEAPKPETPAAEPVEETVSDDDTASLSAFLPEEKIEPASAAKTAIVNFHDVCWVHIKIDGKDEMDFIAEKGNQREIVFHDDFMMDIGNAAVVSISYNNRTIAGLGAYKQPVKGLKFTVDENDRLKYTSVR